MKNQRRDKRTALEVAAQFTALHHTQTAAATAAGMSASLLNQWLHNPGRGLGKKHKQRLALALNIPYEAVDFKNTRICDLPCENARAAA